MSNPIVERMNAPLLKFFDWFSLQVAAMLPAFRKAARSDSKLAEAIEFRNGPDLLSRSNRLASDRFSDLAFGEELSEFPRIPSV